MPAQFENSYADQLEGAYIPWQGDVVPAPEVLRLNEALSLELGLDPAFFRTSEGAGVLSGALAPEGATTLAMAYAGHQFGGFSPQLGDGRAILVGEVLDGSGARRDLHLKGSGRTPFSRGGDGKAVLGPVLREYLMGEAMHALGVPTTRALAATLTSEDILRQNGPEKGAVLARVAASHLRVGTFQFFAARRETDMVRKVADYAIARHDPDLPDGPDRYLDFFRRVCARQAKLIAHWVSIGFVHGVMNTDNMTISGETIDYGPCAFMDAYDPATVFSSIDTGGRYAYGNQPKIAQWNLARLAETLLNVIGNDSDTAVEVLTEEIGNFAALYQEEWLALMRGKLGLLSQQEDDLDLANALHTHMEGQNVDFTMLFRALAKVSEGDLAPARKLFDAPDAGFDDWLDRYGQRLQSEARDAPARVIAMNAANPIYIARNHLVEEALTAAAAGDMALFDRLGEVLKAPFEEQTEAENYALPAPKDFGHFQTFCGT